MSYRGPACPNCPGDLAPGRCPHVIAESPSRVAHFMTDTDRWTARYVGAGDLMTATGVAAQAALVEFFIGHGTTWADPAEDTHALRGMHLVTDLLTSRSRGPGTPIQFLANRTAPDPIPSDAADVLREWLRACHELATPPTLTTYWHQPTDPADAGYWVIQVDDVDENTPLRLYVNDGAMYAQGRAADDAGTEGENTPGMEPLGYDEARDRVAEVRVHLVALLDALDNNDEDRDSELAQHSDDLVAAALEAHTAVARHRLAPTD